MKEFIEKLIGRLEEAEKDCLEMYDWAGQSAIIEAKEIVNQLAEECSVTGGWITCSEKCPPPNTYCLITDNKGQIRVEKYISGGEWFAGFNYVIAWQPLPDPYKRN